MTDRVMWVFLSFQSTWFLWHIVMWLLIEEIATQIKCTWPFFFAYITNTCIMWISLTITANQPSVKNKLGAILYICNPTCKHTITSDTNTLHKMIWWNNCFRFYTGTSQHFINKFQENKNGWESFKRKLHKI